MKKLLGVSTDGASTGTSYRTVSKLPARSAGLFRSLYDQGVLLPEVIDAGLSRWFDLYLRVRGRLLYSPGERFAKNYIRPGVFTHRTANAAKQMNVAGDHDYVLQDGFTYRSTGTKPYGIYTDANYLLTERYFPQQCYLVNHEKQRKKWLELETALYHEAQHIFTWSEFNKRSMAGDYNVDPGKVHIIRPTINLPKQSPDVLKQKRYGKSALIVGFDFERKGGSVLLKAWEEVAKAQPEATLTIMGPQHLDLDPNLKGIRFLGQVLDREKVKQAYESSSLFVMPSTFEAFGLVYIEAMNYGLPCIGTNDFAIPEMITPGHNGWLVNPGDHQTLANQIIEAFSDLDRTASMGANAMRFAQEWPTPEQAAQKLYGVVSSG